MIKFIIPNIEAINNLIYAILDQATSEYNHDVVVASTTPTYAWVFPFGTIPAAIVAGVYGSRATEAYKRMKELRERIKNLSEEMKKKAAMAASLAIASNQTANMAEAVKKAIKPIEAMKGTWVAIHSDLNDLECTVKTDITTLPMCVKSMGVEKALKQWELIAGEADKYRKTAFISQTSEDVAKSKIIQFPALKA